MSTLVQALKAEHVNIAAILGKAGNLGVDTKAGRKALMAAKTGLLAHLKREDAQLYPTLAKAAEDDPVLGDALKISFSRTSKASRRRRSRSSTRLRRAPRVTISPPNFLNSSPCCREESRRKKRSSTKCTTSWTKNFLLIPESHPAMRRR